MLPPHRSQSDAGRRRAQHLRPRGPCAGDGDARQCGLAGLHSEERQEGADGADADPPHSQCHHERSRPAGQHPRHGQLPDPLRLPRDPEAAQGHRDRSAAAGQLRLAPVGLLGTPSRSRPVHRSHAQGSGRRQGRSGDRGFVGHRQGDGDEAGGGRCHHRHLRARRGATGRDQEGVRIARTQAR